MKNYWLERKETKNLRLWEVDDGEQHWYSAEHFDEATRMHLEPLRDPKTGKVDYKFHGIEVVRTSKVDPDTVLSVRMEDKHDAGITKAAVESMTAARKSHRNLNDIVISVGMEDDVACQGMVATKTAAEWAAEGKGLVASTVF